MLKVLIFAGQSNAQGYGNRIQLDPVPSWAQTVANGWTGAPTASSDTGMMYPHPTLENSPSLYNENNSGLLSGVTDGWGPYDGCNPSFGFHPGEQGSYGPELSFLQKYRADHPSAEIAAVKPVLGGSSIEDWLPASSGFSDQDGPMWTVLKAHLDQAKARLAGAAYEWAGLIWMQGESGCSTVYPYLYPTPGAEYSDKLRAFLAAVRAETDPAMGTVIGRIGDQMLADAVIGTTVNGMDTPENRRAATLHRRDQQALVAGDPGNVLADTDGLPVLERGDAAYWYHFTGAGYLAMGERFYAAWQTLAGEVSPPPPPPLETRFNGAVVTGWTVALNGTAIGGDGDVIEITGG